MGERGPATGVEAGGVEHAVAQIGPDGTSRSRERLIKTCLRGAEIPNHHTYPE